MFKNSSTSGTGSRYAACNLHLMNQLPDRMYLYRRDYVLIEENDDSQLYYINGKGVCSKVNIDNIDLFKEELIKLKTNPGDTVIALSPVKIKKMIKQSQSYYRDESLLMPVLNQAMPNGVGFWSAAHVIASLSKTCRSSLRMFREQQPIDMVLLRGLYQALIDDNRDTVSEILALRPDFLLYQPKHLVIKSELTHQTFQIKDNPLTFAVKCKQIRMIGVLMPYYDKLPKTRDYIEPIRKALSAWSYYRVDGKRIQIPQRYQDIALNWINKFKTETIPDNDSNRYQNIHYNSYYSEYYRDEINHPVMVLSDPVERDLSALLDRLIPHGSIDIDDENYLDPALLLLALYRSLKQLYEHYDPEGDNPGMNDKQRDAFAIRIIGLVQSIQLPEFAKKLCEYGYVSLNDESMNARKADSRTTMLMLHEDNSAYFLTGAPMRKKLYPFYRESRSVRSGQGFQYFASGGTVLGSGVGYNKGVIKLLEEYLVEKQKVLERFKHRVLNQRKSSYADTKRELLCEYNIKP